MPTTWRPIDTNALARSKPRSLLVVYFPNEQFMGPNRSLLGGGMAAVVAMGVLGHSIYVDHGLIDPTRDVSESVGTSFARHNGLKVTMITEKHPPPPNRFQVVPPRPPVRPAADLVLEVETSEWGLLAPLGGDAAVYYRTRAKLVDARTNKVIADGYCANGERQLPAGVSYDDARANDAAFIKRELTISEEYCTSAIATKLLLVPAEQPAPIAAPDAGAAPPVSRDAGADATD